LATDTELPINLRIPLAVQYDAEVVAEREQPLRTADRRLMTRLGERGVVTRRLRGKLAGGNPISYQEVRPGDDGLQVVRVDGDVRRVIVDRGRSGQAAFELWDVTATGRVDKPLTYEHPTRVARRWRIGSSPCCPKCPSRS
jgi:hypothetical protein